MEPLKIAESAEIPLYVSPMVVDGRPSLFYVANPPRVGQHEVDADGVWHRSEKHPTPCSCGEMPIGAKVRVVKPTVDQSWKLGPVEEIGRCLHAIESAESADYYGERVYGVGDRVVLDERGAALYELGKGGEWWVEAIGKHPDDQTPIARILDKRSGVFAWAPMGWLKLWKPKPVEMELADGTSPGPIDLEITIPSTPSDDPEITCVICGEDKVTHEFVSRAKGRRSTHGIHEECAKSIVQPPRSR